MDAVLRFKFICRHEALNVVCILNTVASGVESTIQPLSDVFPFKTTSQQLN